MLACAFSNDKEIAMSNTLKTRKRKHPFHNRHARPYVLGKGNSRIVLRYTRPSVLEGMARILDMSGAMNQHDVPSLDDLRAGRIPHTGPKDDAEAIRGYWVEVGQYIRDAMGRLEAEGLTETKSARSDE